MRKTDKENTKSVDVPAPDAPETEAPAAEPAKAPAEKSAEDKAPDAAEAEENGEGAAEEKQASGKEPPAAKPADEPAKAAPQKTAEDAPPDEHPAAVSPPPVEKAPEAEQLAKDLLLARSQLAAHAAGVAPNMIADAVTLATAEAGPDADEAAVTKAMQTVLKRHPEWMAADEGKKKSGGFKLGADPDKGTGTRKPGGDAPKNVKRWNRFK